MTYYCSKCGPSEGLRLKGSRCFTCHGRTTRVAPGFVAAQFSRRSPAPRNV